MSVFVLFALLFATIAIGVPISIALGLSSVLVVLAFSSSSLASLALKLFQAMNSYTLLAIPFFVLSAGFMMRGGLAETLVRFSTALVGHIRGGLAASGVLACVLFAAISGSSPATVLAVGSIAIAGMIQAGYRKEFAAGLICNAGTLGILVPPSIPFIVYAAATETSVGRLFAAGIIPSAVLATMLIGTIYVIGRKGGLPSLPRASFIEVWRAFREAFWSLLMIVIILGGIYGGVFTPTEAAAVAVVYAFVVTVFVSRELSWAEVPSVLVDSAKTSIMLMFIIANALLFSMVLTEQRIPTIITEAIVNAEMSPTVFLVIMNLILLVAGNFMEPTVIILILAPIFLPVALQLGIDPIHLGVIMVVNMEIAMVTPPVGLNLYVTSAITKMDLWSVTKSVLPWLVVLLVFLAIVTWIPILSTWLPDLLFGPETVIPRRAL